MTNSSTVSLPRLERAVQRVIHEMNALHLWDDRLEVIDVSLVVAGYADGWQYYGSTGEIQIPAVSVSRWWQKLTGARVNLADILRHEYGHAFADTHRSWIRTRAFTEAFHAPHENDSAFEYDPGLHVSQYAATSASEDFAETFTEFVRRGGQIPRKFSTPEIQAKWKFIESLSSRVKKENITRPAQRSVMCPSSGEEILLREGEGHYVCVDCRGDIVASRGGAVHEPVEMVTCAAYPESEPTTIWLWADKEQACRSCSGTIHVDGRRAAHEPVRWVACDLDPEEWTLVREASEEPTKCGGCGFAIVSGPGGVEHEAVNEVECHEHPGHFTIFSSADLEARREIPCEHCGSEIRADEKGYLDHSVYLEPLAAGTKRRAWVIVHGFLNWPDKPKNYALWMRELGKLHWDGHIYGYHWSAFSPLLAIASNLVLKGATLSRNPAAIAAALALNATQFAIAYRDARAEAEREGQRLAKALRELRNEYSDVRVLGFSLGCRVVLHALRTLVDWGHQDFVRVRLAGGAVPASDSWIKASRAAKGPIYNFHSDGDYVLKGLFPVGEFTAAGAIGSVGLSRSPKGRTRNIAAVRGDYSVHHFVSMGRGTYEDSYSHFGKL